MLYEELTLDEHLRLTAMAYGIEESVYKERVNVLIKRISNGEKIEVVSSSFFKRNEAKGDDYVCISCQPSLYIVDEPFVGLDPLGIQSLLDLMRKMKESGAGILMSTHILATAERYCDRFIILHEGKVRAHGTMEQLRDEFGMPKATLDDLYIQLTKEEDHV